MLGKCFSGDVEDYGSLVCYIWNFSFNDIIQYFRVFI